MSESRFKLGFLLSSDLHENPINSAQTLSAAAEISHASAIPIVTGIHNETADSLALSGDQLEPEPEEDQPIAKIDDRPVTSQSSDWTISALRDKLDRGQLDLQPKFQREYVWNSRPTSFRHA